MWPTRDAGARHARAPVRAAREGPRASPPRAALLKPDGSPWQVGDRFASRRWPPRCGALLLTEPTACTRGPWGARLVAAVQADGGVMTMDDLALYDVIWSDPTRATVGDIEIAVPGAPNAGGLALIEAQQMGVAAGITRLGHWSRNAESLRRAALATQGYVLDYFPPDARAQLFPGIDARLTGEHGQALWTALEAGKLPISLAKQPQALRRRRRHRWRGNMARHHAQHQLCVLGEDGDQRRRHLDHRPRVVPAGGGGARRGGPAAPTPTETGLVLKNGTPSSPSPRWDRGCTSAPSRGCSTSSASGCRWTRRSTPRTSSSGLQRERQWLRPPVVAGRFPKDVLDGAGCAIARSRSIAHGWAARGCGWRSVAIRRPASCAPVRATRNNSAALAW
ncbi:MAG: gamma-glutamyltransferase [Gemmatimonadetes bacterium]|nr:gamma-glutamyltransferase [Gemmatimonadota bacterium]